MKTWKTIAAGMLLSLMLGMVLTSCVGLWDPRSANAPASDATTFQRAALTGYANLAGDRLDQRDYDGKEYYLTKAAAAASGQDPLPEEAPAGADGAFADARARLAKVLDRDGRDRAPRETADSQLSFDCWLLERVRAPEVSAACKDKFAAAIVAAEKTVAEKRVLVVILPKPDGRVGAVEVEGRSGGKQLLNSAYAGASVDANKAAESLKVSEKTVRAAFGNALAAMPERPEKFRLFFQEASDTLTSDSLARYKEVFKAVRDRPSPEVEVVGHTDKAGGRDYNFRLSKRRAEAIRLQLVDDGIDPRIISTVGRGEVEPWIRDPSKGDPARNRRVEITVR